MRVILLIAIGAMAFAVLMRIGPIPQDPSYHDFADKRSLLGIPNFGNVVSNFPFVIAGALGIGFVLRRESWGRAFITGPEGRAWLVVFAGVLLTGLGSAWYHLEPSNERLLWDRLPMTLVFMGLSSVQIMERIHTRTGSLLLVPLLLLGIASLLYWRISESRGTGDLRFYGLVQYYPMVAIPLMICLFPPRYTRSWDLAGIAGCYMLAKAFEMLDGPIFHLLADTVSGHTLKHLVSAASVFWLLVMLAWRRPLAPAPPFVRELRGSESSP